MTRVISRLPELLRTDPGTTGAVVPGLAALTALAALEAPRSGALVTAQETDPRALPEPMRWRRLRRQYDDIHLALSNVSEAAADERPELAPAFRPVASLNRLREDTLLQTLQLLGAHAEEMPTPADAVLATVDALAELRSKDAGHMALLAPLTRLLWSLVAPQDGSSLADLHPGWGHRLVQCPPNVAFTAQFPSHEQHAVGTLVAWLDGRNPAEMRLGDPLRAPLMDGSRLKRFDRVIATPPFGQRLSRTDVARLGADPHHRFRFGPLHTRAAELAVVQHALAALRPSGRAVVLASAGVLFRGGKEGMVRQALLRADAISAIIAVPTGTLKHTGIATTLLVLDRDKPPDRQNRVFLVSLKGAPTDRGGRTLTDAECDQATEAISAWRPRVGFARDLTLDEMAAHDFVLNPARFIDDFEPPEFPNATQSVRELAEAEAARDHAATRIDSLLAHLLPSTAADARPRPPSPTDDRP